MNNCFIINPWSSKYEIIVRGDHSPRSRVSEERACRSLAKTIPIDGHYERRQFSWMLSGESEPHTLPGRATGSNSIGFVDAVDCGK